MDILNSIKNTIKYADKYGGKLTDQQLFERLIGNKIYGKEEIYKFIKLSGYKVVKSTNNKILEEKIEKAEELAKLIEKNFKDILFMGITGSVAAGYPKKNDDIDIIIITKTNRLWITRLKLRYFVTINKIPHRKFEKREKKDDFCFNLWLDEKSIKLKKNKQNLKNGIDLLLIKPLINKEKTYEKFLLNNDWVKKYVASGYNEKIKNLKNVIFKKIKDNFFWSLINLIIFLPQFLYMKKSIKNETIGLHEAFFHRNVIE